MWPLRGDLRGAVEALTAGCPASNSEGLYEAHMVTCIFIACYVRLMNCQSHLDYLLAFLCIRNQAFLQFLPPKLRAQAHISCTIWVSSSLMTTHRYASFFSSLVSTGELSSLRAGALISTDGWMEMISFESWCPGKRCLDDSLQTSCASW